MDEEEKKHVLRKRFLRLGIMFVAICAAGGAVYFAYTLYRNSYGTFGKCKVVNSVERTDGTSVNYAGYNGLLLKYSRDGASALNEKGEFAWNGSYEMKDPIYDICGEYVVIGDRGSKVVHIFNSNGAVNSMNVDYPILQVQISDQGRVAVMMEEDNTVYIYLYERNLTLMGRGEFPIAKSGFPLSFTLSEDGYRYLYSALDVNTGKVKTNMAMYNFGDVGQNEINNFVGGIIIDGTAVKVDFLTNDIVVVYTDQGCYLYKMAEKPSDKPIAEITFDTAICSVFSSPSYVGFVVDSSNEKHRYQVVIYNLSGKKIVDMGMDFEYSNIQVNGNEVVFYNYAGCMIINTRGTVRYEGQFAESVEGVYGISANKYYLVKGNKIDLIQLKGAK